MPDPRTTKAETSDLTHVGGDGRARMVGVGDKPATRRWATAEAVVRVSSALAEAIASGTAKKGAVLEVARLAGIQAAKRTDELIPLCHNLPLDRVDIDAELRGERVHLTATAETTGRTGVEMEAMTAVSVAALTVYDMGKAIDRAIVIERVRLLSKTGGQRGDFHAEPMDD